jgi:hypothetical protein
MRAYIIAAVLAVHATGSTTEHNVLSALAPHTPTMNAPSPGSPAHIICSTPPAVQSHVQDGLE